ncbi:ABC transporter substrate-binding protein [Fortiea sp. LEGE XX443]|uniref:protein kinase domain-containing protein n=1 Tax=Fortiea sp. LEGE XX443 TaxID=1828611 RepID=UPI0018806B2D|nr:ABC transporter substrate-binding protein [Fortiea sp. LEGE XX443]MBE9004477.1 ABC transporter substrate-binding protein [Fortiea sp. LEGE XX443]
MRVYCTNPNCHTPENDIADKFLPAKGKQKFCSNCGMRLVLRTRYIPLEQIGSGGFGRTFRAWDSNLEHECLIKQLRLTNISNAQWTPAQLQYIQKSFKREAQALCHLNHPQIPRLWDFFELSAPQSEESEQTLETAQVVFYLVQDYIKGSNLRQLKNERWSEDEVTQLLRQILPVLDYIHNLQPVMLIHRDIKPENIILDTNKKFYLIDFGAVKQAVTGIPAEQSIAIATPGYASPEQRAGLAVYPSSDLYSLAATCVSLLTLKPAEDLRIGDIWSWRRYVDVSDKLATILDTMLSAERSHRFQSARQVMEVLENQKKSAPTPLPENPPTPLQHQNSLILEKKPPELQPQKLQSSEQASIQPSISSQPPRSLQKWRMVLIGGLGSVILGLLALVSLYTRPHNPICIDDPYFSCGEKSLLQYPEKILGSVDFRQGTEAFKKGQYQEAIENFSTYLSNYPNMPEFRIYLNNARAAKSKELIKIAICLPILKDNGLGVEQLLRGIAVVQEEINTEAKKSINGKKLLIQICNDQQNRTIARQVAEKLMQDKQVLGVVGHYFTLTTSAAGKVYGEPQYGDNRLVSISPTSTAVRETHFNQGEVIDINRYVFRVSPRDFHLAKPLVDYILNKQGSKIAIFFNHLEPASVSFSQGFKKVFGHRGQVVNECDFFEYQNKPFVVSQCLQRAKKQKTDIILLTISRDILNREINKILQDSQDTIVISGPTAYLESVPISNAIFEKLVIAVQWHRSSDNNLSLLEQKSLKLWGTKDINFASAMTYDATQALVEGLRRSGNNPTRKRLYDELSKHNFMVEGAKTKVRFDKNHDRAIDQQNIKDLVFLVSPKDGEFQIIK